MTRTNAIMAARTFPRRVTDGTRFVGKRLMESVPSFRAPGLPIGLLLDNDEFHPAILFPPRRGAVRLDRLIGSEPYRLHAGPGYTKSLQVESDRVRPRLRQGHVAAARALRIGVPFDADAHGGPRLQHVGDLPQQAEAL